MRCRLACVVLLALISNCCAATATAATDSGRNAVPKRMLQQLVDPAAADAPAAQALAVQDLLADPAANEDAAAPAHNAMNTFPRVSAMATVGPTPTGCTGNAAYIQTRLFCQYTALGTACRNIVEALVKADIGALNNNIASTTGSTRKMLCYLGMVDSSTAPILATQLSSASTTPDLLMVYSWAVNSVRGSVVFTAAEQAAIEAAMKARWLKKLFVWHSINDPAVPSGVPLLSSRCSLWNATTRPAIHTEASALSGSYPAVSSYTTAAAGFSAAWGSCCPCDGLAGQPGSRTYAQAAMNATVAGTMPNELAGFSFCRPGGGLVFFSTVPADLVYTKQSVAAWQGLRKFHPAALSVFADDATVCA